MMTLLYILVFLSTVFIYIHLVNYYTVNDDVDYIELFEPLKSDYEKVCQQKIPFSILFSNSECLQEAKTQLSPPLLYKQHKSSIYISNESEDLQTNNSVRNIIFVPELSSDITVKLFPPKCSDILRKLETSIWDTTFLDNVKHLKITLKSNSALVIPPFWFYSLRLERKSSEITDKNDKQNKEKSKNSEFELDKYEYITYINQIANYINITRDHIFTFLK